ncbi:putative ATPase, AAA family domain-containing protein [Neospora caninum Liverpool]|uniref:Putative ATPase, AAA family domain-containing protein n=1 Tax=Neospora caninum (strain Liverpool) TaxID=572307 RepID=F0VKH0_NEOCL|nr:putative ATPase, AAA family domain-containing protein [Neospora caninum Liverpool]CBZ54571.1 putative ATPase, AAA family domain-containing protein [Neospora caninum Liverpool]|eukprot:XP_003884601.1 putative ATPase, AAA family domain-containing protein [Neospora caninum Liverpool]
MECVIEATVSTWGNAPPLTACGVCASAATLAQLGAVPSSSRFLRLDSDPSSASGEKNKPSKKVSSSSSSSPCPGACIVLLYCAEQDLSPPVKLPLNKFLLTPDVLFSLGLLSPFSESPLPADSRFSLSFLPLSVPLPSPSPVTLCLTRAPGDRHETRVCKPSPSSSLSSPSSSLSSPLSSLSSLSPVPSSLPFPPAAWWEELLWAAAASQVPEKTGLRSACAPPSSLKGNRAHGGPRGNSASQHSAVAAGVAKKLKQRKPPPVAAASSPEAHESPTGKASSALAASLAATPQASQGLLRFLRIALNGVSVVNGQFRSMTLQGHPVVLQFFAEPDSASGDPSDLASPSPGVVTRDSDPDQARQERRDQAASAFARCFRLSASTQILFTVQPKWRGASEGEKRQEEDDAHGVGDAGDTGETRRGGLSRVAGLHRVLPELLWSLILPLLRPDLFQAYGVPPPKGVLLYGPPGSGKTHLARAVAEEIQIVVQEVNVGRAVSAGASPLSGFLRALLQLPANAASSQSSASSVWMVPPHLELVNATDLISPVLGQTERNIHLLFERCRSEQQKRFSEARAQLAVRAARAAAARAETERDTEQTPVGGRENEARQGVCRAEETDQDGGGESTQTCEEVESRRGAHASDSPATLVGGGTLLFIDEIDAVCPKREEATEVGRRAVCALLSCLDGLATDGSLFVLAATNHPHLLDDAIRRAGRLERDIEVGVPTAEERREILAKLLQNVPHNLRDEDVDELSGLCQAFVPADLRLLVTTAATQALKALLPAELPHAGVSHDRGEEPQNERKEQASSGLGALATLPDEKQPVTLKHFRRALRHVKPSALKSVAIEVPHVKWDEIGGYASVKKSLQECVEWPIKFAHLFRQLKVAPPRGVLLYGPPGCSKTMMAKAVATESKMNFISVKGPELFSKWVGESERAVREVFRKARQNAPCVIFFDEVDAMGGDRETGDAGGVDSRVLSQLLNEMDGIGPVREVVVIAATNRPDLLDAALLRPGRLDRLVYVPLPDREARREIALKMLKNMPVKFSGQVRGDQNGQGTTCADSLARATHGYSGAEIVMICREASMAAVREAVARFSSKHLQHQRPSHFSEKAQQIPVGTAEERTQFVQESPEDGNVFVEERHLKVALSLVQPRTPKSLLAFYEAYHEDSP